MQFYLLICVDVNFQVTELSQVKSDMFPQHPSQNVVRFACDGGSLLTGGEDGVVRVWKVKIKTQQEFKNVCLIEFGKYCKSPYFDVVSFHLKQFFTHTQLYDNDITRLFIHVHVLL